MTIIDIMLLLIGGSIAIVAVILAEICSTLKNIYWEIARQFIDEIKAEREEK